MDNKVGIYARISKSDSNNFHSSVEYQVEGITEYCNSHYFSIVKIYKDIGYSGANFNRPAFKELMQDMFNGLFNTIVVKDLSRFGRNHLEVGKYLDEIFLINDVRFIAIDDNYDNKGLMDEFAAFKNIFNEMYLKDIRKKIKTTFDYKAKSKLLNSRPGAFYGLTINENGKYIIDEKAASVVRRIFSLYIDGYSTKAIATLLTKECIITPGYYRYIKYNDQSSLTKHKYKWKDCTIYKIITNEGYTGKIINRKYLYMRGKRILNPNPVVIEHGLPQIIDEITFNKAQDIRLNRPKKKDKVYINPYPNRIQCGCCNKVMRYTYSKSMNQHFFVCSRCKTRIYIDDLKHILKEEIQTQLSKINDSDFISYIEKSIQKIKKEIKQLDVEFQKNFEDYAKEKITEDKLKLSIAELTSKKNELQLNLNKNNHHTKTIISKIINCKIEDGLILKLITTMSVISVGKRKYEVHINYNFKD